MNAKSKVLIVDDDEIVRLSLLRSLRSDHRNVEIATDGNHAISAMEQHSFDVVLLDLRLPGMDGMSVLKTIKQKWPASEVVIITAYPTIETAVEAVRLGAFDYLAKPVGPDEVINAANGATTQKRWTLCREHGIQTGATGSGSATSRETSNYAH